MNILKRIIGLFALGFTLTAAGQELAPDQLVQKVTEDVLAGIKSDKQLAAGDKQKALKLAEEKVLPHIDFEHAVRLAAGAEEAAFHRVSQDAGAHLLDRDRAVPGADAQGAALARRQAGPRGHDG